MEQRIETLLLQLREEYANRFVRKIRTIAASDNSHPRFIAVTTIREAARAAQDNVFELLAKAADEVSAVSKSPNAFGFLKRAMLLHLSVLAGLAERWNGVPLLPDNLSVLDERFAAVRQDLIMLLEANQDRFKNPGGRPEEWNWDGAKAHVKAQYPDGFKKRHGLQTEIAEAMTDWFEKRLGAAPGRTETMRNARALIDEHQGS